MSGFTQEDADCHRGIASRHTADLGSGKLTQLSLRETVAVAKEAAWHDEQANRIEALLSEGEIVRLMHGSQSFSFQLPDRAPHYYSFIVSMDGTVNAYVDGERAKMRRESR